MRASILRSQFFRAVVVIAALLSVTLCAGPAMSHAAQTQTKPAQSPAGRSPSDTVREFYKALREKRFRDAFVLSFYKSAVEGLKPQELEDFRPDFEKLAVAITERMPANLEVSGETISGDLATVFVKVLDVDGKEKMEPASLFLLDGNWIVGDREGFEVVKKSGKKYFFNARIDAHHDDVQDMLTRISLALLLYSQQHDGKFANLPTLIAAGMLPKDLEGTDSTGYRFQITVSPDFKTWNAQAEPAQYGRSGKLSFFMDAAGVRSGDVGGKPLTPPKHP
jgi:hypothetical protein